MSKGWHLLKTLEMQISVGKSEMDNSIGEERRVQKHFGHLGMMQEASIVKNENIVCGIRGAYNSFGMRNVDRSTSTRNTVIRHGALCLPTCPEVT